MENMVWLQSLPVTFICSCIHKSIHLVLLATISSSCRAHDTIYHVSVAERYIRHALVLPDTIGLVILRSHLANTDAVSIGKLHLAAYSARRQF